jgi:hypothetical protein
VSVEIDLLAPIDAAKVLPKYHVPLMTDRAEHYQSNRVSPVRDVMTRPTDDIDTDESGASESFLLFVFPYFVSVQLFGRSADQAFAAAFFDDLPAQLFPSVPSDPLSVGAQIAAP